MKLNASHAISATVLLMSATLCNCGPGASVLNNPSGNAGNSISPNLVLVGHHFSSTLCGLPSASTAWCSAGNDDNYAYGGSKQPGVPIPLPGITGTVTSVGIGKHHTCAVVDGSVQCFGSDGSSGEIGNGSTSASLTPVTVAGLGDTATAVVVGVSHSCALLSSKSVKCWGGGGFGNTGDGTNVARTSPVSVSGLGNTVIAIAAGQGFTCALLSAGTVQCWGDNSSGQLGDGTTTVRYSPVTVSGLSSTAIAIASGEDHMCALLSTGTVQCWGYNNYGQLGDNSTTNRSNPVTVNALGGTATAIAAGHYSSCALLSTGDLRCWGDNFYGQLGAGTTTQRQSPVTVAGLSGTVKSVAVSYGNTCASLSDATSVLCWGLGAKSDGTNSTSPVAHTPGPTSDSATALAIFSSPTTATIDNTCIPIFAATISASGGLSSPVNTSLSLALTKTSGTFYSNNTCTNAITTITLPSGANSVQFYYKSSASGSTPTIGVSSGGLTTGSSILEII